MASWVSLAIAGDPGAGGLYWYRDGHPVALESLDGGRRGTGEPRYRSAHGGVVRRLTEWLEVCVPDEWDGARVARLEREYGLVGDGGVGQVRRYYAGEGGRALAVANAIFEREGVDCAAPLWRKEMGRRALNDPLLGEQWHLNNGGTLGGVPGADLNAFVAWEVTRGSGVVVGVADDGIEIAHPDLEPNVLVYRSRDYVENDGDPTAGDHGTSVAGVVAAAGNNGLGGAGVAPEASLVGLRIMNDQGMVDESGVAEAFSGELNLIDVVNNSWGPPDTAENAFEGPSALERSAFEEAIRLGRDGLGRIFVWAGGNGGEEDNSNLDGYANLRYTIAVTASSDQGSAPYYAEEGANLLVNAPSSGGARRIVTTDRSGRLGYNSGYEAQELGDIDFTSQFGGTSAATPAVSGGVALMLATNPDLNWREVQQVLAASASHNDPDHPRWRRNAAGYWINEQYGFGRVDAGAAVALAGAWGEALAAEATTVQRNRDTVLAIPDDDPAGVSSSIEVTDRVRVEFVEVTVDIEHTYWGDLAIYLVSPSGTEVRLMTSRYLPPDARSLRFAHWVLGDTLHLGESAPGRWTLRVVDEAALDQGTLLSWGIRVYGAAVAERAETLPFDCAGRRSADGALVPGASIRLGVSRHGAAVAGGARGLAAEDYGLLFAAEAPHAVAGYLMVAEYRLGGGGLSWFQYDGVGWSSWDGRGEALRTFQDETAAAGGVAILHQGRVPVGEFRFYGGYRERDGGIVYCPQPLMLEVM